MTIRDKLQTPEGVQELVNKLSNTTDGSAMSIPVIQHLVAGNYTRSQQDEIRSVIINDKKKSEKDRDRSTGAVAELYNSYIDKYNLILELANCLFEIDKSEKQEDIQLRYRIYVVLSTTIPGAVTE
jgi:hypothetical protein